MQADVLSRVLVSCTQDIGAPFMPRNVRTVLLLAVSTALGCSCAPRPTDDAGSSLDAGESRDGGPRDGGELRDVGSLVDDSGADGDSGIVFDGGFDAGPAMDSGNECAVPVDCLEESENARQRFFAAAAANGSCAQLSDCIAREAILSCPSRTETFCFVGVATASQASFEAEASAIADDYCTPCHEPCGTSVRDCFAIQATCTDGGCVVVTDAGL